MASPRLMSSDDELVARIRAGDDDAFDTVVREHFNALCLYASRIVGSDAAAEEVVQDVLLKVWEQRARWDVSTTIAAYLYGSVRNRALSQSRRERFLHLWKRGAEQAMDDDARAVRGDEPLERMQASELAREIDAAVAALPPRCREVFVLRRRHHLSGAEVARLMGIAPKTVEIQMGIALKALRRRLAHLL